MNSYGTKSIQELDDVVNEKVLEIIEMWPGWFETPLDIQLRNAPGWIAVVKRGLGIAHNIMTDKEKKKSRFIGVHCRCGELKYTHYGIKLSRPVSSALQMMKNNCANTCVFCAEVGKIIDWDYRWGWGGGLVSCSNCWEWLELLRPDLPAHQMIDGERRIINLVHHARAMGRPHPYSLQYDKERLKQLWHVP